VSTKELPSLNDPFLRRTLMLAVDGTEPQELRKMAELEIDLQAERDEEIPRVFESAGGYSPTVGIIGAVLGLIQVMQHLDNIEEVGRGIAVAFVATIYGVAFANLFCLPAAAKLKIRRRQESLLQELMLEGVISILEGLNPRLLELKLAGFLGKSEPPPATSAPKVVSACAGSAVDDCQGDLRTRQSCEDRRAHRYSADPHQPFRFQLGVIDGARHGNGEVLRGDARLSAAAHLRGGLCGVSSDSCQ
jgi:hypothetical protein